MRRWRVLVPVTVLIVTLLSTLAAAQRGRGRGVFGLGGPALGTNPDVAPAGQPRDAGFDGGQDFGHIEVVSRDVS